MIVLFKETGFDPSEIVWWGVDRHRTDGVICLGVAFRTAPNMIIRETEDDFQDVLAYLRKGDYVEDLVR